MGNKLGDLSSTQVRLAAIFAINNGIFSIKKKKKKYTQNAEERISFPE